MKLRYLSDIHLEFIQPEKLNNLIKNIVPKKDEICILAGDIGNPYQENYKKFMDFINDNFKKTFVIAGNHEYYNNDKTIDQTNEYLVEFFRKYSNISFLNNTSENYLGYNFIGTTLWTKVTNTKYKINDVYSILNFSCKDYNDQHNKCVDFLSKNIKENIIVITHHVPSKKLIDKKYMTNDYNEWFYCDMDELIEDNKDNIKCWIYGHTHTPSIKRIQEIPFLCNPIGYPNENTKINYARTITLK